MATNQQLNESIIQLTRDVNDLTDAVNVKKQVLDQAVDDAEAADTRAAGSAASAANSQSAAASSAGAAAQSEANAAAVVTGGDGSLTPAPGKLPIADSRGKINQGWLEHVPSRAEFEARAEQNRRRFGGSGFVEWGKHLAQDGYGAINEGMFASTFSPNDGAKHLYLGRFLGFTGIGASRTELPIINANGAKLRLRGLAKNGVNINPATIDFPSAPADSSLLSRQDLVFVEVWHEKVSDKDVVYPHGNVQNHVGYEDIPLVNNIVAATYSAFGAWESTPSAGFGLRWSTATADQKDKFLRDPYNNLYVDDDTGDLIQVRWRIRTVPGLGLGWSALDRLTPQAPGEGAPFTTSATAGNEFIRLQGAKTAVAVDTGGDTGEIAYTYADTRSPKVSGAWGTALSSSLSYDSKCIAIPIALVQRRNQGIYHPVYNSSGTAALDQTHTGGTAGQPASLVQMLNSGAITSTGQCFSLTRVGGNIVSGVTGRPDGKYYDQIHADDVKDLRNDANRVQDMQRYLEKHFRRFVAGQSRGFEGNEAIVPLTPFNIRLAGDGIVLDHSGQVSEIFGGMASRTSLGRIRPRTYFINGAAYSVTWTSSLRAAIVSQSDGVGVNDTNAGTYFAGWDGSTFTPSSLAVVRDDTASNPLTLFNLRTPQSANLLHCDIIGDPANYPAEWLTNGIAGVPLVVDDNGNRVYPVDVAEQVAPSSRYKEYKLARKYSSIALIVRFDGSTYTALPGVNSAPTSVSWGSESNGNRVFIYSGSTAGGSADALDNDVFLVFYATPANPTELSPNAEFLAAGGVRASAFNSFQFGAGLVNHLVGKVATSAAIDPNPTTQILPLTEYETVDLGTGHVLVENRIQPAHGPIGLAQEIAAAAKALGYLSRKDGAFYLNMLFRELRHDGTDYGDNGKLAPISNVAVSTDLNGQTVLAGTKRIRLDAFALDTE